MPTAICQRIKAKTTARTSPAIKETFRYLLFINLLLLGTENSVSGISESRYDITDLVELFILGCQIDVNIRMILFDYIDAFLYAYKVDKLDVLGSAGFTMSMAALALPPVASIGSRIRTMESSRVLGNLA